MTFERTNSVEAHRVPDSSTPRVAGIFLYPVKSCRGHAVTHASVDAWGFVGDRRYLVVSPDGEFFTQRQHPQMARIDTELTPAGLRLGASHHGDVFVPLAESHGVKRVTVWKNTVEAEDCGEEVSTWLTRVIGTPARLLRMGRDFSRPVKPAQARAGDQVSFADAFPFLAISEASLAELNDRIVAHGGEPVPMDRFRSNLVISGCAPFAEDGWRLFRAGEVTFRHAGPCARCSVTTTDQQTGERGKEPLRTLATFRRDPHEPGDINFGVNLVHETKHGSVRVGDFLTLL